MMDALLRDWTSYEHTKAPFGLIISPTRELAMQITNVMNDLGKKLLQKTGCKVEVATIVGGMSEQKQRRILSGKKQSLHFIVATPGRLCEILEDMNHETCNAFKDMSTLRFLVVDEADRIMEDGHYAEVMCLANHPSIPLIA